MGFVESVKNESRLFFGHRPIAIALAMAMLVALVPFATDHLPGHSVYCFGRPVHYSDPIEFKGLTYSRKKERCE